MLQRKRGGEAAHEVESYHQALVVSIAILLFIALQTVRLCRVFRSGKLPAPKTAGSHAFWGEEIIQSNIN